MKLSVYRANPDNRHKREGNPSVKCNAVYKKAGSLNCYLKTIQAIQLARNLLQKAQLILDEGLDDAVVQLWNAGPTSETLSCGIEKERKGGRRKRSTSTN